MLQNQHLHTSLSHPKTIHNKHEVYYHMKPYTDIFSRLVHIAHDKCMHHLRLCVHVNGVYSISGTLYIHPPTLCVTQYGSRHVATVCMGREYCKVTV